MKRCPGKALLLAGPALCCACSGLPPALSDAGQPVGFGTPQLCTLGLEQDRAAGACRVAASGDPLPIVIHRIGSAGGPLIGNDDQIDFPPAERGWRLRLVGAAGELPAGKPLTDGSLLRLRDGVTRRYLAFGPSGDPTEERRAGSAALIAVYKADFVNPDRPSTCDPLIRDGDYVYLRALSPSRWLREADAGSAISGSLVAQSAANAPSARTCTPGAERCRTDDRGAVQCASIPCCGD